LIIQEITTHLVYNEKYNTKELNSESNPHWLRIIRPFWSLYHYCLPISFSFLPSNV